MTDKKTKTFVYKHARFKALPKEGPEPTLPDRPLGELLVESLADTSNGRRRERLHLDGEAETWRLIGEFSLAQEGCVKGVLMRFSPGVNPQCLVDDVEAERITVQQLAVPQTLDGKQQEMIEGLLYFVVVGNHLVMMQSSTMRSVHLERHLLWLLRTMGKTQEGVLLSLDDQARSTVADILEANDIKEIELDGDLFPEEDQGPADTEVVRTHTESRQIPTGNTLGTAIWSAIKDSIGVDQAAGLDTTQLAGANISYELKVHYVQKTTGRGHVLLNQLGAALRHSDSPPLIRLKGGGSINGSELRVSGKVQLKLYDGVPSTDEVWSEMWEWLQKNLRSGVI